MSFIYIQRADHPPQPQRCYLLKITTGHERCTCRRAATRWLRSACILWLDIHLPS